MHDPDTENGTSEPDSNYATRLVNLQVKELGDNRFEATVIHEFSHAAVNDSTCPYQGASGADADHPCGGITADGEQTPLIIANVDVIPDSSMCFRKSEPVSLGGSTKVGAFTTSITDCTKNSLEEHHDNN